MKNRNRTRCVRCEALERAQKHSNVHIVNDVPLCDACIEEIAEEEAYFEGYQTSGRLLSEDLDYYYEPGD